MRTIHRYLLSGFIATFLSALIVLLFVMSLGAIFKLADLIGRGAPWKPLGAIFLLNTPQMLSFSMPMGIMVGILLVFGRLSADGEITAMRSCGISLWQIASGPFLFTLLMGAACLFIHNNMVPYGHRVARQMIRELKNVSALSLLEEGRFIHAFPGMSLYVGRRNGPALTDVRIYTALSENRVREIQATSGVVQQSVDGTTTLELTGVRVDPFLEDEPGAAYCRKWTVTLPGSSAKNPIRLKPVDYSWGELRARIRQPAEFFPLLKGKDLQKEADRCRVEIHKRLVLSAACPLFALLGIPLGIQTHRKESTAGIAMSTFVILAFHIFIVAAESLRSTGALIPILILWAPVLLGSLSATWLMERSN